MTAKKPNITAVLITRDAKYPPLVWERLDPGFFDEILVRTKCPCIYDRYIMAAKAKNEIIYVQDDDALVNYQVLFSKYDGRLTCGITQGFANFYAPHDCTLVGWGAFFPRTALKVFDKYVKKYGVDVHLNREADRIFTYLNRPFNNVIFPHQDLKQEEPARMYKEPGHFPSMDKALAKCRKL